MTSIRQLEELALNAWPALESQDYDGWIVRYAGGYTRRANSVAPLDAGSLPLEAKLAHCEAFYDARGADTIFKLTDAAHPDGLDRFLDHHGFEWQQGAIVETLTLPARQDEVPPCDVSIASTVNPEWVADFSRLNNVDARFLPAMSQMLASIVPPAAFVTIRREGRAVAVGLAVLERGYLGLFDIVVDPADRRQGLGRQLVLHLLNWGLTQGASTAYLQVVPDNVPALRLYERLGFREQYRYWYRARRRR